MESITLEVDLDELLSESLLLRRKAASSRASFLSNFTARSKAGLERLSITSHQSGLAEWVPELLDIAHVEGAGQLQALQLDLRLDDLEVYVACCESIAQLSGLRQLRLGWEEADVEELLEQQSAWAEEDVGAGDDALGYLPQLPLDALSHLASLSHLQELDVDLPFLTGALDIDLLASMPHLTRLAFANRRSPFGWPCRIVWHEGGEGLQELQLHNCYLVPAATSLEAGVPPSLQQLRQLSLEDLDSQDAAPMLRMLPCLQLLQRLELRGIDLEAALPAESLPGQLPSLQHLTALTLQLHPGALTARRPGDEEAPPHLECCLMQAVLSCGALKELGLGGLWLEHTGVDQLPPGALRHLTRLELQLGGTVSALLPPPWCELPALRALHVDGSGCGGMNGPNSEEGSEAEEDQIQMQLQILSELSRLQSLEELSLRHCCFTAWDGQALDLPPCITQLTSLTRLDLSSSGFGSWEALQPGCLPRLRELHPGRIDAFEVLLVCMALAPQLEVLDLSQYYPGCFGPLTHANLDTFRRMGALTQLLLPHNSPEQQELMEFFDMSLPAVAVVGVEGLSDEEEELWVSGGPSWEGEEGEEGGY